MTVYRTPAERETEKPVKEQKAPKKPMSTAIFAILIGWISLGLAIVAAMWLSRNVSTDVAGAVAVAIGITSFALVANRAFEVESRRIAEREAKSDAERAERRAAGRCVICYGACGHKATDPLEPKA